MTTRQETIVGFILKSMSYKESDALLTVYTKDYGKITLLAKGIKKVQSKNAAGCQTLTLSEFVCIPKKGISTLIKAHFINYYRHIKEDIVLETYASYFCEFIYKFVEENDPNEEIYAMFLQAIDCLEQGYSYELVYALFNAWILKISGTPLIVDECSMCGKTNDIVAISISGGGFVCQECVSSYDTVCDKYVLQAFRHINKFSLYTIDKIKLQENDIHTVSEIMEVFIEEYTGITFKTKTFIKQFKKYK